jgi:kanamycin kinase
MVWRNEVDGLTFELRTPASRRFLKWAPHDSGIDLGAEAARLGWAHPFHPVPRPLDGGTGEYGTWLLTEAIDGEHAVADRWRADPATAVRAIGEGLRALHEDLPVTTCPFSWSVPDRLADIRATASAGGLRLARWHADHHHLTVARALSIIEEAPPVDRLVVCHGRWTGHVDMGELGVADRWADIAIATWSTTWNYGPGWEETLLAAYGIQPDPDRTRYYRLLWDLG